MQTLQLQAFAPAIRPVFHLTLMDIPAPGAQQVQIRVTAAGINPIDLKRARGYGRRLLGLKKAATFPITLGNDFVGEVVALGGGVRGLKKGDTVIGVKPMGPLGTHTTVLNVHMSHVRQIPRTPGWSAWGVLPYTYTTMRLALAQAGVQSENASGKQVLIHGASGGLGLLALQTLSRWGAQTTAVCRTEKIKDCKDAGAATCVARDREGWRDIDAKFDVTLNFAVWQDDAWLVSKLRKGALGHATTVHPLLDHFDRLGWIRGAWNTFKDKKTLKASAARAAGPACRYAWTIFRPDRQALDELANDLVARYIQLPIHQKVPLSQGPRAFEIANADAGRVLLLCNEGEQMERLPSSVVQRPFHPTRT